MGLMRLAAALPVEALLGVVMGGDPKIALLLVVAFPLSRRVAWSGAHRAGVVGAGGGRGVGGAEVVAFLRTRIPTIIPAAARLTG